MQVGRTRWRDGSSCWNTSQQWWPSWSPSLEEVLHVPAVGRAGAGAEARGQERSWPGNPRAALSGRKGLSLTASGEPRSMANSVPDQRGGHQGDHEERSEGCDDNAPRVNWHATPIGGHRCAVSRPMLEVHQHRYRPSEYPRPARLGSHLPGFPPTGESSARNGGSPGDPATRCGRT
jgi:hypothetical protein